MTLRSLHERPATIVVAVATSGASGVDDADCDPPTAEAKAALREAEQRKSCRLFGLPEGRLAFLRLDEDAGGHPLRGGENLGRVAAVLAEAGPDAVFLPHGHDTNVGHQRIYALVRAAAEAWVRVVADRGLLVLLNRDPKTIAMREDVLTPYGEERAAWKAALLRCHLTQQRRNLRTRGHGFDERILGMDRETARRHGLGDPYAEAFEVQPFTHR